MSGRARRPTGRALGGGVGVGILATLLVWARAPFAPKNFWGEDGARFFAHALEDGWIEPIGRSLAGYFHLLPRVLGPLGTVVPLEWAPGAVFVGGALAVGWFAGSIRAADQSVGGGFGILLLALTPVLLPITGFESIGNVANLHFLMLCAAAVVLVGHQDSFGRRANDTVLVAVAGLTSPITLGLAPLVAVRCWADQREGRGVPVVAMGWGVGIAVQLLMIATMVDDERVMEPDRSITKIGFLLLERVVAYNVVPFWPRISGADASSVTFELAVRAAVALVVVGGMAALVFWAKLRTGRALADRQAVLLFAVPATGAAFFLGASWLVGSEPRYAVFPAFCIVWTLLMATRQMGTGRNVVVLVLLAAMVTHWLPSELRRTGPSWRDGVAGAEAACRTDPTSTPTVPILPDGWSISLDCRHLDVG